MRRFLFDSSLPNEGDFAMVEMRIDSDSNCFCGILYRISHYSVVLLSNCDTFNGSGRHRAHPYFRDMYQYGFTMTAATDWKVSRILSGYGFIRVVESHIELIDGVSSVIAEPIQNDNVEYEDIFSDKYEKRNIYSGYHGYHAHHGTYLNKPIASRPKYLFGIELEVEFITYEDRNRFTERQSNWFFCERDGSLGDNGCEIITIPLIPTDAKDVSFWKILTDNLTRARSWDTGRCGLHVHISRSILGSNEEKRSESLGKLLYLYHHHLKDTMLNRKIYGRSAGYHECDGKTDYGNAAVLLGKDVLKIKDIQTKIKEGMISTSLRDRYFDINLRNENTIEFRKGRGSINPERIVAIVDYCERMCIYAVNTPWQQIDYHDFVDYLLATAKTASLKRLIEDWS